MKAAVMSDIHGNHRALESCVEYALRHGARAFIFLGDYCGELANPQLTMGLLYDLKSEYRCFFVRGNKEDYWLEHQAGGEKSWKEYDSTTGSLYYTYNRLTKRDLEFYRGLDISGTVSFDGLPPVTVCHGSPIRVNQKLLENEETRRIMETDANDLILCGHSHSQRKIAHGGKTVLDGGAVGVPIDSGGLAQFVLLEGCGGSWRHQFVSLEYDVEGTIEELYESGLDKFAPCWTRVTANLLRGGRISHAQALGRAMELCREGEGSCVWPYIPEKYWEQAVDELIGRQYLSCIKGQ